MLFKTKLIVLVQANGDAHSFPAETDLAQRLS